MRRTQSDRAERVGHDHTCHAAVKFSGDPRTGFWWLNVVFTDTSEIDNLIRLLTDLRDNPKAQRFHIHLQDHRMCRAHPEFSQRAPEDAEIMLFSPKYRPGEFDVESLQRGAKAMRSFWRPPAELRIPWPPAKPKTKRTGRSARQRRSRAR